MGLALFQLWNTACVSARNRCAAVCLLALAAGAIAQPQVPAHTARARRFLAGRASSGMKAARQKHAAMLPRPRPAHEPAQPSAQPQAQRSAQPSAQWTPVGPAQIASLNYGTVTGRVTSVAIDPADPTGNTVYLGTTGGGVWKSTNAAGIAAGVTFTPLTDNLAVFNNGAALASLSIGAVSVSNGVLLAGTGDPNDALDSYYGSGILRSADGGTTWTLIQQSNDGPAEGHLFSGLGFAGFAWSGAAPSTVVAAVSDAAEGLLVNAGDSTYSTRGLYYSQDAGVTWQMATIVDPRGSGTQIVQQPLAGGANHGGNAVTAVVWNPVRQRFYAAVRYHGYYESADGTVWTRLASQPGLGLTSAACPPNPNATGSAGCPIFRGALAVEPASGDLYAFTVDAGNLDQGIWRDVCSANAGACASSTIAFATRLDSSSLEEGFGSTRIVEGDYSLSLAAAASATQTLLFAGTVDLYRCALTTSAADAGGCAFRNTTNTFNGCDAPALVAPAQHAIAVEAGLGPLLYLANDGGLWRSNDGVAETGTPCSAQDANHFQNLNAGLGSLAEVIAVAQDPSHPGILIVGVGANGTATTSTAPGDSPWPQLAVGEGGYVAIDQAAPANWYVSTGPGISITNCAKGSQCSASDFAGLPVIGEQQVDEDASVIDAPWILDSPSNTDGMANVILGTCRVWRGPAADGSSWPGKNAISAEFGTSQQTSCAGGNSFVRSVAAGGAVSTIASGSNAGSTVIYAGLAGVLDGGGSLGGHIFATTAADHATPATAWSDLALNPVTNDPANGAVFNPQGFDVSSLAVDSHDPTGATVYATIMGFGGSGETVAHVYRSADGGAHWANISSNLPDAPANAVVVDPNAGGTVYVAMDTGVYATTAVSACATADCWSVLAAGLPNAPAVTLQAAAGIPDGLGASGELRVGTYGRGIWETPLLSALPVTTAALALAPASLDFGSQAIGTVSAAQTVTVTNTGAATLTLSAPAVTGDFAATGNCAGVNLAAGGSCTVRVTFAASALGSRTGTLTVVYHRLGTTVAAGQGTVALAGNGVSPAAVALNPNALNFGAVVTGAHSPAQSVTVINMGGVAASLGAPSMSGDFSITANGCSTTLAPGTQCSVGLWFAPAAIGTRNGTFSISASSGTQTASLTGVGESPASDSVSPGALNFGQQQQNVSSTAQTVTLANTGDTPLSGISATVTGAAFALANGCGTSLPGHSACMMTVTFTPASTGPLTGTLTVTDSLRAQNVLLSGVGYPPPQVAVKPGALSFAAAAVGTVSPVQQLTVSNSGGGLLALGAVTVTGDFAEADSCTGAMLGVGIHCAVNVTFSPAALGTRTGTLTIAGSGSAGGVNIPLTGVGATLAAIAVSPASLDFGTIIVGQQSGTVTIAVSNTGGLTGSLGPAAVTGDFQIHSNFCGAALSAGAQCLVGIVFTPAASGPRTGTFTITGPAGPITVTLSGTGLAPATDTITPASLTFAPQQVGTASAPQTVTVTNSGDATLTGLQPAVSPASFKLANGCATSLAGHAQCVMSITFDPSAAEPVAGTLRIQDQLRSQAQSVALNGTGLSPAHIVLTPAALIFGSSVVGTTTAAQNLTLSNTGGVAAALQTPLVMGDYALTANTCGASLAPGVGCTVGITFSPTTSGSRPGTLTVVDSAGTQTAPLSGTGLAPAADTLSPLTLTFGQQVDGTTSAAQSVTLTNTGDAPLSPIAAAIASGAFSVVNNCGGSLAAHSNCTIAVTFSPAVAGPSSGVLTVSDALRTQSVALFGTGIGPALAVVSPTSLGFALTALNVVSAVQKLTLSNAGGGTLTSAKPVISGDFQETDDCAGAMLGNGAACTVQVAFTPSATGARTGTLIFTGSAGTGSAIQTITVALSGTGASPGTIVLTPASLSFGGVTVGTPSPVQNLTVSNTGGLGITLANPAVSGDFSISADTCGTALAAGSGCTIGVVFTPTISGPRSGMLTLAGAAGTQALSQTATLNGTGLTPATDSLTPLALNFGSQQYGTTSPGQAVTLTNSGDQPLNLIAATVSAGFAVTNTCGVSLAGHSSCVFTVTFSPAAGGAVTGALTVSDAMRTQTVQLSGTGLAPPLASLAPAALSFTITVVGTASPPQTVTVTNTGGGSLIISSVSIAGDFAETETCTRASLAAGGSCTVQVVFSPAATGPRMGTLTLLGNMPGGQATAALGGVGAAAAAILLTPTSLNFGTVTVGSSAPTQNIAVSNTGGVAAALEPAAVTGDFALSANTCGATLAAGTGCTITIGFSPSASGARTGVLSIAASSGANGAGQNLSQTAALAGIGAAPATDGLSPPALTFAAQTIGTTSSPQTVTLTNTGDNALTLVSAAISSDFAAANNCGPTLAGHSSCTIAVTYAPQSIGAATGALTVSDQFRTQTVALSGTGIATPGFSISPASLTFNATGLTTVSPAQTLTLSNTGTAALALSAITATGDFNVTAAGSTCGLPLCPPRPAPYRLRSHQQSAEPA